MGRISVILEGDVLEDRTIVLFGTEGSGKSATGNSILGRNKFVSKRLLGGLTLRCHQRCHQRSTVLEDDRVLNVIDTPGLFDLTNPQAAEKEIVRCIEMAKDGIHAALLVVSLLSRFSDEEKAMFETLKHLFGERIVDYLIVVFTGGDELEDSDEALDEFLENSCSGHLIKELLQKCGNRKVVFNNKTKDNEKKTAQRNQLLTLISDNLIENGGQPYTHEEFLENKILKKMQQDMEQRLLEVKKRQNERKASIEEIRRLRAQLERALMEAETRRRSVCGDLSLRQQLHQ